MSAGFGCCEVHIATQRAAGAAALRDFVAVGHFRPTLRVSAAIRCLLFPETDLLTGSNETTRRAKNGSRPGASGARNRASTNPHSKVACVVVRHLTRGTMRPCTLRSPMAIIAPAACSNRCRRGGGRFAERGCGNRAYRHVRSLSAERFPCPAKNGEGTA
jgi:hypothetical protein